MSGGAPSDSFHLRPPTPRIACVDWMRGLSVVLMVAAHALAFLSPAHDHDRARAVLNSINGVPAPIFILLSGFSLAYVSAKAGQTAEKRRARAAKSLKRLGLLLLVSVFLRHVLWKAFSNPIAFVWVDILECIALMLFATLAVLTLIPQTTPRLTLFALLTLGAFVASPVVAEPRQFGWLTPFINNSWFSDTWPLIPWAGYGFLGALIGVTVGRSPAQTRTLTVCWLTLAVVAFPLAWAEPLLDRIYAPYDAYRLANAFERLWRIGVVGLVLTAVDRYAGARLELPAALLHLFSRHSLVAWPVHLVLLFGWSWFRPFNHFLFKSDWTAYVILMLTVLTLTALACLVADRLPRWIDQRRQISTGEARP